MQLTWLKNIQNRLLSFLTKHKQYILYHLKWQVSILITAPCMWFFQDFLGWNNISTIITFQFLGAVIFWNIDKFIFKK